MSGPGNPAELRRPFMVSPHETALAASVKEQLVNDVTGIIQRARYVEAAPAHLWEPGLVSELAGTVKSLAFKIAKLEEKASANG